MNWTRLKRLLRAAVALAAVVLASPGIAAPTYDHDIGRFATAEISPVDAVRDSAGNWWVMDEGLQCLKEYAPDLRTVRRTVFTCGVQGKDSAHITRARGIGIHPVTDVVWVADTENDRLIKVSKTGTVLLTTDASGAPGGRLDGPWDVAVDSSGYAYAIDLKNRIVKVSPAGVFVKQWGSTGSGPGQMTLPQSIAWSGLGGSALYVTDARNFQVDKFGPNGFFKGSFGSQGTGNGQFTKDARGVAVGANGVVYASDVGGNRIVRFAASGAPLPSLGAGLPYHRRGAQNFAYGARGVFVAGDTLGISDMWNFRVLLWELDGTSKGQIGGTAPPADGHLEPRGVALDSSGNVYVSDYWHQWIQKFAPDGTLLARWGIGRGSEPGTLNLPGGLAVDNVRGFLYIANREQNVVDRWKISDGSFSARLVPPGGPTTGKGWPRDVAVNETTGNVYVADSKNDKLVVMSPAGSTLAAATTYGSPAQRLGMVTCVALDTAGNVYVGDWDHSLVHVYDSSGHWLRTFATQERPNGLDVKNGVVWVLGWRVGEYSTTGSAITHWGGSGGAGDDQFNQPYVGVAVDAGGRIYIGDSKNHRVKVFVP
jgi:tripartite motif-containing protein 71